MWPPARVHKRHSNCIISLNSNSNSNTNTKSNFKSKTENSIFQVQCSEMNEWNEMNANMKFSLSHFGSLFVVAKFDRLLVFHSLKVDTRLKRAADQVWAIGARQLAHSLPVAYVVVCFTVHCSLFECLNVKRRMFDGLDQLASCSQQQQEKR